MIWRCLYCHRYHQKYAVIVHKNSWHCTSRWWDEISKNWTLILAWHWATQKKNFSMISSKCWHYKTTLMLYFDNIFFNDLQKITVISDFVVHRIGWYCIGQSGSWTTISRCAPWSLQRWCIEYWRPLILALVTSLQIYLRKAHSYYTCFKLNVFWNPSRKYF